jgi:hypothetical protein
MKKSSKVPSHIVSGNKGRPQTLFVWIEHTMRWNLDLPLYLRHCMRIVTPADSDVQFANMPGQVESGVVTEHNSACKILLFWRFKRRYNGMFLTLVINLTAVSWIWNNMVITTQASYTKRQIWPLMKSESEQIGQPTPRGVFWEKGKKKFYFSPKGQKNSPFRII